MSWLLAGILAYFFIAIGSLFDRYFLVGPVSNVKVYTFYVGILGILGILIIPFFGINFNNPSIIILGILIGFLRMIATFFLSKGIAESEVSRVVPAIGGMLPIFSFILFFLFYPGMESLNFFQIIAFSLLIIGSVLISLKKLSLDFLNFKFLKYPALASFVFALSFFMTKGLFTQTDFLSALFLILSGGVLWSLTLLILKEVRRAVFEKGITVKTSKLIILGQICGGLGAFLQQYAIFLAKPFQVPLINALEGTRDTFLIIFVFVLSIISPKVLKEKIAFRKVFAILLIFSGLAILALK